MRLHDAQRTHGRESSVAAWTRSSRAIERLAEQEELKAIRADLDGNEVMEILDIPPGKQVGEAVAFLLEARLDEGPLGKEEAKRRLLDWWSARN